MTTDTAIAPPVTGSPLDLLMARFKRFLDRKAVPRHLEGKAEAQADEVRALIGVLERFLPKLAGDFPGWWARVEEELGMSAQRASWPTEKELADACRVVKAKLLAEGADIPLPSNQTTTSREAEATAAKMRRGEGVSENHLYGTVALEIEFNGLVPKETLDAYRKGAYSARSRQYGAGAAVAWITAKEAEHDAARANYGKAAGK